jgi:glycerol kinase
MGFESCSAVAASGPRLGHLCSRHGGGVQSVLPRVDDREHVHRPGGIAADLSHVRGDPREVRLSTTIDEPGPIGIGTPSTRCSDRFGGHRETEATTDPTYGCGTHEWATAETPLTSHVVIAIDAGTTGVRSRAVFSDDRPTVASYREFTQHFPRPGWVEHDADEIWAAVRTTLIDVIAEVGIPDAIGITNQRETVLAWDRRDGRPYGRAIVWQDRRTAEHCTELTDAGHLPLVRAATGLVLDPYFSGTKIAWMLDNGLPDGPDLAVGTIDSWIVWKLTGRHVTDTSNASRTMLFDIRDLDWSAEMCDILGVPLASLPDVVASSGRIALTLGDGDLPSGVPVSGIAGDQQSALFGQACIRPGMAKNTYGTGSFVLVNVGSQCPAPTDGMLTTVAWTLADGTVAYALEGSIFATGAAVQWLRDGLGIIETSADIGPLADTVPDSAGVYVVPAFTGLGSPWWDPHARGTVAGITRGTNRAHLARAVIDAMAFQTRDVIDAMERASGVPLVVLRVDGGASASDLLLRIQADQLGVTVHRPRDIETTALGAAFLAGLAEGVWPDLDAISDRWELDLEVIPTDDPDRRTLADAAHADWIRAVERSREWATDDV